MVPNHVIHLVLQTPPPSDWRTSQPYGNAEFASLTRGKLSSPAPTRQMFPTTLWPPKHVSTTSKFLTDHTRSSSVHLRKIQFKI